MAEESKDGATIDASGMNISFVGPSAD
jgi:serine/threonine protein kinase